MTEGFFDRVDVSLVDRCRAQRALAQLFQLLLEKALDLGAAVEADASDL